LSISFDWDAANLAHIAEHGVARGEAEEAVSNRPIDMGHQTRHGEERLMQIGATLSGRVLVVITTRRGGKRVLLRHFRQIARTVPSTVRRWRRSMEKRILPDFKSEAEEAKWWFDHQDELLEDFEQAAKEGRLGRGTAARLADTSTTTVGFDPEDIALAQEQASKKGLEYQTYLKMLVHEALVNAKG
jgi:predicted DNA binding CopG/RHH family protein/uncharacterized DUF497 family protein